MTKKADDDLIRYRLRYKIGETQGVIAPSELLDDFQMRAAASENLRAGMNYRVRVRTLQAYKNIPAESVTLEAELVLNLETEADDDELKLSAKGATADFHIRKNTIEI